MRNSRYPSPEDHIHVLLGGANGFFESKSEIPTSMQKYHFSFKWIKWAEQSDIAYPSVKQFVLPFKITVLNSMLLNPSIMLQAIGRLVRNSVQIVLEGIKVYSFILFYSAAKSVVSRAPVCFVCVRTHFLCWKNLKYFSVTWTMERWTILLECLIMINSKCIPVIVIWKFELKTVKNPKTRAFSIFIWNDIFSWTE